VTKKHNKILFAYFHANYTAHWTRELHTQQATPNLKKILMQHWHIIQQQPKLKQIFNQQPIVSYRKEKSLKDILVRAKLPSMKQQSQNQ